MNQLEEQDQIEGIFERGQQSKAEEQTKKTKKTLIMLLL